MTVDRRAAQSAAHFRDRVERASGVAIPEDIEAVADPDDLGVASVEGLLRLVALAKRRFALSIGNLKGAGLRATILSGLLQNGVDWPDKQDIRISVFEVKQCRQNQTRVVSRQQ